MRLTPGTILGPYRVVSLLGSGGMGEVYRAEDPRLGRQVALKVLHQTDSGDPDRVRRFEREARAASALQHPGIVTVFDVGSDRGVFYIVSELLEGTTLRQRMQVGAMPPSVALELAIQVAEALDAAHEAGVVHRDIKPENLFITRTGRLKILDFGLARRHGGTMAGPRDEDQTVSRTSPGVVLGTAGYMSPEQVRGAVADRRSDVFSLGAVLYEMLSGRRAFRGRTVVETLAAILHDEPEPLSAISGAPAELTQIINRCLRKDANARYGSAGEMLLALRSVSPAGDAPAAAARAVGPRGLSTSTPGRRRLLVALVTLLVAALGTAFAFRSLRRTEPPAGGSAPDRVTSQIVPLRRLRIVDPTTQLDSLTRRIRKVAADRRIEMKDLGDNRLELSGPENKLANAVAALRIRDALDGYSFDDAPNLFRTGELSSRTVSFEVSSVGMKEFVFLVATAARWPVVVDQSIEGTLTLKLEDVRWDEAVRTVLKLGHITATRFGGVWFVSSEVRLREIEARELPLVYRYRPQRTTLAAAAAALEPARSSGGAIAANHRLGIVVIVDRLERFPTYGRILTTIERGTAPLKLPTRVYHDLLQPASSGGEVGFPRSGLSLDFLDAEVEDVLLLYRDILGMNVVAQPGIKGRTTIFVTGLGVEEALDLMLRSTGLSYEVRDNILRVFPEAEGQAEVTVETVALAREDPEFFRPFTRCLTPAGALQIDSRSRTLIIRDVSGRAAWLRQLAEEIDRETGG